MSNYQPFKTKRIGKITIPEAEIRDYAMAIKLFTHLKFVPLSALYLAHKSSYEYVGLSDLFDEIKEVVMLPEYIVTVNTVPAVDKEGNDCLDIDNVYVERVS